MRAKSNNVVESWPSTQAPISEVGRIIILRVYKGFIIIHYALQLTLHKRGNDIYDMLCGIYQSILNDSNL